MLNKDYYYLLPENVGQSGSVRFVEIKDTFSAPEIRTSQLKSVSNLEVNFPIDKEKLAEEENLEWEDWASILDNSDKPYRFKYLLINNALEYLEKKGNPNQGVLEVAMELARRTPSNCQLYIGLDNPLGYAKIMQWRSWKNKLRQIFNSSSVGSIRKRLQKAGFKHISAYPIIVQNGVSEEIVFQPGYVSYENSYSLKERIKEILLGKRGIKLFASAYCLVASKVHLRTYLDGLIESVCEQITTEGIEPGELQVYQFISLLLPRKVILTLGDDSGKRLVVILSRWRLVAERRDREARNLQEMEKQRLNQLCKFPKYYGTGEWQGLRYHVIEAIEGITIDTYLPQVDKITEQALVYLGRLRNHTSFDVEVTEANYGEIAGWIFSEGREKHAKVEEIQKLADRIEQKIRQDLLGQTIGLSRMHGDFKIENILVERKTVKITGIIDWEHSRATGLPSLDLWYLFLYNRQLKSNEGIYEVIEKTCFNDPLNDQEIQEFEKLNTEMGYSKELGQVMKYLFILHHIMCRMTHDYSKPEIREKIEHVLSLVLQDMEERETGIEYRKEAV